MNSEEAAVERANVVVMAAKALREAGYVFIQTDDALRTSLEVSHPEVWGWHRFVSVFERRTGGLYANRLTAGDFYRSGDMSKTSIRRMIAALDKNREQVLRIRQNNQDFDALLARYDSQRESDLADLKLPEFMDVHVNIRGPYAGTYYVRFDPNNIPDRLTAPQVRRLVQLFQEFEREQVKVEGEASI